MSLDADQMQRIILDVVLGRKPPKKESVEERRFRQDIERDVADAKRQAKAEGIGLTIDIPADLP